MIYSTGSVLSLSHAKHGHYNQLHERVTRIQTHVSQSETTHQRNQNLRDRKTGNFTTLMYMHMMTPCQVKKKSLKIRLIFWFR